MLLVEVSNQRKIQDVTNKKPGALFWAVFLPVHQIMDSPAVKLCMLDHHQLVAEEMVEDGL